MRWINRFLLFALLATVVSPLLSLGSPLPPDVSALEEYKLKSIWIFRICKYTFWPGTASTEEPFVISVLGKLPADSKIRIPRKTIHQRQLEIRYIQKLDEIKNSDVLFIAPSQAHRIRTILDYVKGRTILTVGDTKGFGQKGVIINFYTSGKALRFQINREAIKRAKLQLHSQLFAIGQIVKSKAGER